MKTIILHLLVFFWVSAAQAQSLWRAPGATERSLFADPVAAGIGDVITILVVEEQTVQDDGKLEVSKDSSLNSSLSVFDIKPNTFNTLPGLAYESGRSVDGESKYSQSGKFETTITAVVVDVKPNGVLLVEGRRGITIDRDRKMMTVRGLVRPLDLSPSNTVMSDRIANAEICYENFGARARATKKNWLERALDFVWPF